MTRTEVEQAVLALGQRLNWPLFPWLPGSSIGSGEPGWRLFVETHSDRELQRVLEEAQKDGLQRADR